MEKPENPWKTHYPDRRFLFG